MPLTLDHKIDEGEKLYPEVPFRMLETQGYIHRAAPCLGADTEYVLKDILGMSEEEIRALDDEGVLV